MLDEGNLEEQHHRSTLATNEDLQIFVEPVSRKRTKEEKTQHELELAFKRRLNRDLKEKQLLLHKSSLLLLFGRSYNYNRLLNDLALMQAALKLLPGAKAYPRETGTELKYFQSFVTWFKTVVKLSSANLYAEDDKVGKTWADIKQQLLEQIKKKEARCKQDMIFILIALIRGMGLQCRLVVNLQPLPLKPAQEDLLTIKMKADDKEIKKIIKGSLTETITEKPTTSAHVKKQTTDKSEHNTSKEKDKLKVKTTEKIVKSEETEKARNQKLPRNLKTKTDNVEQSKETLNQKLSRNEGKEKTEEKIEKEKKNVKQTVKGKNELKKQPNLSKLKSSINENAAEATKIKEKIEKAKEVKQAETIEKEKNVKQTVKEKNELKKQPNLSKLKRPINENATEAVETKKTKNVRSTKTTADPTSTKNSNAASDSGIQLETSISPEPPAAKANSKAKAKPKSKSTTEDLSKNAKPTTTRVLRSRQNSNTTATTAKKAIPTEVKIPQLDGPADDKEIEAAVQRKNKKRQQQQQEPKKAQKTQQKSAADDDGDSDADFEPSPPKQTKRAPVLPKAVQNLRKDRRILSTDNESDAGSQSPSKSEAKKSQAADMWIEVWSDVENEWICVDLFKGKLHSVEAIRKSASSSLAYVFAFQNDLSLKDVTARYCPNWATTVRKNRVEHAWLEIAIFPYYGRRTDRDIREDHEMRRIHEQKPLPTSISDFKDHPLYALERHLLKFQAIYPPNPPTIGFTKTKEPIYSRDCVHTLHSRDIWLKQARTVKLGEEPYKIVKARPKWDRLTQTVIKDQPLEIFGYWQTQDYEPPTAENGIVPRNAYGNVELFKECMLPKKTVHLRLNGLSRICKKLNIDCANAVVGFDFHQGACHPTYDGFIVCEEFADQVTAAWYQDQEDQERKEQEKYEARVYGNWKKLIKGLLIRERIKRKYNF